MAPGSQVVTDYLTQSGLLPYLEELRFHVVGYGCMTCIGNSGPLPENIHNAVDENGLVVASVLSGNRNFEARIHPLVRANYLASPVLVVAYALAGRADIDLYNEPLGHGSDGKPVFLADIWPSPEEIRDTIADALKPEMFTERYASVSTGDENWQALPLPEESSLYEWADESTYVRRPPSSRGWVSTCRRRRTSRERGCSRSSASRSRPTTSRPPARSRRPSPPASTCGSTGCR